MNHLSSSDYELLHRLVRSDAGRRGSSLAALSREFGVSSSFLSQRLKRLAIAGLVDRQQESTPTGRQVQYVPRECLNIQWISPSSGASLRWMALGPVDWEFPLASQVPDLEARTTLLALLRALGKALPGVKSRRPTLVVYGSTMRGKARPGADVDVLALLPASAEVLDERLPDVVATVSLESFRPIQLRSVMGSDLLALPKSIQEAIQREGAIVMEGAPMDVPAPLKSIWEFVYGGRPPDE